MGKSLIMKLGPGGCFMKCLFIVYIL